MTEYRRMKEDWRKSDQYLMPQKKVNHEVQGRYNLYPATKIEDGKITGGFETLALEIADKRQIIIDGYVGVFFEEFKEKLIAEFKKRPMRTSIITNGTLLLDRIQDILHAELSSVSVSINSIDSIDYKLTCGGNDNTFDTVIKGIQFLAEKRRPSTTSLFLSFVLTRNLFHRAPEIIKFAEDIKSFYCEDGLNSGYIMAKNREGVIQKFPFMTVSSAVICNGFGHPNILDDNTLNEIFGILKKSAKRSSHHISCVDLGVINPQK